MFKSCYRCAKIFVPLFVFFLSLAFAYPAAADELDDILKRIGSKKTLQRRFARSDLTRYLEKASDLQRAQAVRRLIDSLDDPSSTYQDKLGICEGLGKMRSVFWEVENQAEAEKNLYTLFKKEKDPGLRMRIEDALMTAKGLFRDGINDYNNERVDDPEAVTQKFRRVFESYPDSSYAPIAHYYLAKYFTRAYFILKNKNMNPAAGQWIEEKSNKVWQDFISKAENYKYKTDRLPGARYFLALNFLLLNQLEQARAQLQTIIEARRDRRDTIYIYQYYFSSRKGDVIDKNFPARELAQYTLDYLQESKEFKENSLDSFVTYLKNFKPEK